MFPGRFRRRVARLRLLCLENRLTPASFAEAGAHLNLDLAANEVVGVVSGGTSYTLTLASGTWSGIDSANVVGDSSSALTITAAGQTAFNRVNITDSGARVGVDFNTSGANTY